MNTESNVLDAQPRDPSQFIAIERLRTQPFDIATEARYVRDWQENGGSMSPNHVARITVDPEVLDEIKAACDFEFSNVNDQDRTPDLKSVFYLEQLQNAFESIVKSDLGNAMTDSTEIRTNINLGWFQENEYDKHLDQGSADMALRYGVTLIGPTTQWIEGPTSPKDFDDSFDCVEGSSTDLQKLTDSKVGVVEQFACDSYPHGNPVLSEPEFRITLFATVLP